MIRSTRGVTSAALLALCVALASLTPVGCGDVDNTIEGEPVNLRIRGRQTADYSDRNAAFNRNEPINALGNHPRSGQRPPVPVQRVAFGVAPTCLASECVCPAGLDLCDELCVDVDLDEDNCGECGRVCDEGAICSDGDCDE